MVLALRFVIEAAYGLENERRKGNKNNHPPFAISESARFTTAPWAIIDLFLLKMPNFTVVSRETPHNCQKWFIYGSDNCSESTI